MTNRSFFGRDASTGDVILLSGTNTDHIKAKRLLRDRSTWTQIAIVIAASDPARPSLLLSTLKPLCPDTRGNPPRPGVQLVFMDEYLRNFEGTIGARDLVPAPPKHLATMIADKACSLNGMPFKVSRFEMYRSGRRGNRTRDETSFFCCELVAYIYQECGILPRPPAGWLANNFVPDDFGADGSLEFMPPFGLGPVSYIRW